MDLAVRSQTEVRALTHDWFETKQKCSPSTVIGPEQNKNIAVNGSLRNKIIYMYKLISTTTVGRIGTRKLSTWLASSYRVSVLFIFKLKHHLLVAPLFSEKGSSVSAVLLTQPFSGTGNSTKVWAILSEREVRTIHDPH